LFSIGIIGVTPAARLRNQDAPQRRSQVKSAT
jgi:hypothetical protein